MRVKRFLAIVLIFTMLFSAPGCSQKSGSEKAWEYYEEFMEASMNDRYAAFVKYVHYESDITRSMALESVATDTLISYEILDVEELSDSLWVIRASIASAWFPDQTEYINFVGIIDGEYRVMTSYLEVPEQLSDNIDLTPYIPDPSKYADPRSVVPPIGE